MPKFAPGRKTFRRAPVPQEAWEDAGGQSGGGGGGFLLLLLAFPSPTSPTGGSCLEADLSRPSTGRVPLSADRSTKNSTGGIKAGVLWFFRGTPEVPRSSEMSGTTRSA